MSPGQIRYGIIHVPSARVEAPTYVNKADAEAQVEKCRPRENYAVTMLSYSTYVAPHADPAEAARAQMQANREREV